MLTHSFKINFNLGPVVRGEEDDAFKWIRTRCPVAKYITVIEMSYKNGWTVELVHPLDIGPHQISELLFQSYKALVQKPWRPLANL